MLSDKLLNVSIQSFLLQKLVPTLPPNTATRRELLIQNQKLLRMTFEQPLNPGGPQRQLGGSSIKKLKKRMGRQAAEISAQEKKVRPLAEKFFKEHLRLNNPALTNASYRAWKADFDSRMNRNKELMRKHILQQIQEQEATPQRRISSQRS